MNRPKKKNSPIYAAIMEANDDRTVAALVLFDRRVKREFHGPTHLADAQQWVARWDDHLEQEWDVIRATATTMMEEFSRELARRGVPVPTINAALKELTGTYVK